MPEAGRLKLLSAVLASSATRVKCLLGVIEGGEERERESDGVRGMGRSPLQGQQLQQAGLRPGAPVPPGSRPPGSQQAPGGGALPPGQGGAPQRPAFAQTLAGGPVAPTLVRAPPPLTARPLLPPQGRERERDTALKAAVTLLLCRAKDAVFAADAIDDSIVCWHISSVSEACFVCVPASKVSPDGICATSMMGSLYEEETLVGPQTVFCTTC